MLALALAFVLWGLWAATLRLDRKYRFELYAFDFAFGALLTALVLAFTLGNSGSSNTFTFEDNLTVASKRNMAMAVGAGIIFCLGNLMTMASVALSGLSTALPASAAMALIITVIAQSFGRGPSSAALVYGSAGVAILALVVSALAQKATAAATPVKRGMHAAWKGYILGIVGGVFLGAYTPVLEISRFGEIGLGAYAAIVFLALGSLLMTPLVNLYFLNLPVQGEAISLTALFKATVKQHLLGVGGGAMWTGGAVALYSAVGAGLTTGPRPLAMFAVGFASAILGSICGLTVFGEGAKAKAMHFATLGVLAAASAMLYLGA